MLTLFLTLLSAGSLAIDRPPNVLILMTDDLRPDAVGYASKNRVHTPNIDAIAERGMVFHHAYCFGGNSPAVCMPSRNMFLSGRTYFRWAPARYAPADGPSVPRTFNDAGFDTFHVSKAGNVAVEIDKLFSTMSYLQDEKERTSGEPGRTAVNRAIDWLGNRSADRPFLMYVAFEAPHDPRVADQKYRDEYADEEIPLPANFMPEHPFDNGELRIRDEKLADWPRTEEEIKRHLTDYYADITGLDHHIGRLIKTLKDRGEYDRTIIVFTSDNGLAVGSHGLMGKQNLYEHSAGVPLVMAGPGIPAGTTDSFAYLLDVFPTLCELTGIDSPADLDGVSLAPILKDANAVVRPDVFMAYRDVQRACRSGPWKLIHYPAIGRTQLFNLDKDPDELDDRSAKPKQAKRVEKMFDRLERLQAQMGDELVLKRPALTK